MTIPQIQHFAAGGDPALVHEALEEDGAAILQGAIPIDVIERFNRELDPYASVTLAERETIYGVKLPPHAKYVGNLPATCKTFRQDILNNTYLHTLCENQFQQTGDYWLTAAFLREVEPGSGNQDFHRDEATHPLLHYQKLDAPPIALSFILALTDFTPDNGATQVILGSHRWAEVGRPSPDQAVLATMKAGDVLAVRQGVVHAGGKHLGKTTDMRRAVLVYFNSCQLTPFETFMTMPRELVETMTPLAQKMIGWRSVKPALPNVSGLHTTQMRLLEDELQLKSNQ